AERVVQLVRARVEQVLALQVDALPRREPLGERQRCRAAAVLAAEAIELRLKGWVGPGFLPACDELVERRDQRLRDVAPAVAAVQPRVRHRAASTKARTRSWSLTPGADSRLEEASTAHGRTSSIAARTFSGPRPPASTTRPSVARARSRCRSSCSCQ